MFVSYLFTTPLDRYVTTHWACSLDLAPPREALKTDRITNMPPRPSTISKRCPKGHRMRPKTLPRDTEFVTTGKIEIYLEPLFLLGL